LFKDIGKPLYDHFLEKAKETNIPFEQLNIQPEHVHALIDLPPNRCLSDIVRIIKGESTHWINKNKLLKNRFGWQRGYGAYSVSATKLKTVKSYIQNLTEHHKRKTFTDEYEEWKKTYGIYDDQINLSQSQLKRTDSVML